eukprot:10219482-Alexandrium_andersonii.AAC.1
MRALVSVHSLLTAALHNAAMRRLAHEKTGVEHRAEHLEVRTCRLSGQDARALLPCVEGDPIGASPAMEQVLACSAATGLQNSTRVEVIRVDRF